MTEQRPPTRAADPATGVARGSLGTGSNVDDDTKRYEVAEITWRPSGPPNVRTPRSGDGTPAPAPVGPDAVAATIVPAEGVAAEPVRAKPVAPGSPAPAPATASRPGATAPPTAAPAPVTRRRDPYRPIGIALGAVLVTLAGVALLSNGSAPIDAGVPPAATETPANAQAEDGTGDEGRDDDGNGGSDGGNNGNGRGNGNGNGPGGNNGRGNDD